MKVLLSIKPEFAAKIFNGTKKYEYRRIIFKNNEITTVIVYATDPIKKVIGEFEIGEILHEEPQTLWAQTQEDSGLTETKFRQYFTNKQIGYAIRIKETKKYEEPFPLAKLMVSFAPQSFRYVF
jgi:predicted transcriptional regulator